MISFTLALDSHPARSLAQLRELRRDNGLCADCSEPGHDGCGRLAATRHDKKRVGACTYPGCWTEHSDTAWECEKHRERSAGRKRTQRHRERTGRTAVVVGE